jgi:soluble lytic murein transglycosylase-like protein
MRAKIRNNLIVKGFLAAALLAAAPVPVYAGNQMEEQMSSSVRAALHKAVSDHATPFLAFASQSEARAWLDAMSSKLARQLPDTTLREEFLVTVHYEAKRAGLDPQLVLGLIQVESAFRKYAVSVAGARGLMQVMPFWVRTIGTDESNLFHLRTNLRFGCVILRHYIDMEQGNLFRALGRYNGSLGRPEYPNMVLAAWRQWDYTSAAPTTAATPAVPAARPVSGIVKISN